MNVNTRCYHMAAAKKMLLINSIICVLFYLYYCVSSGRRRVVVEGFVSTSLLYSLWFAGLLSYVPSVRC